MFPNPAFTLADQLFWIVDYFRKAMWADPRTRGLGALSVALWNRVKGLEQRFSKLYAMWKAGTLPKRRSYRAIAPPQPQPSPVDGEGELGANYADRAVAYPSPRPSPTRGEGE